MNAGRIDHILTNDPYAGPMWRGFLAPDVRLPPRSVPDSPELYVVNTAPSHAPGEHWCVFFRDANRCDFFDSYGLPPSSYSLCPALPCSKHGGSNETIFYNPFQLQDFPDRTCGHHCLFFALHRAQGFSLKQIINTKYNRYGLPKYNDDLVLNYIFTNYGPTLAAIQ